jgi:Holliday junction DNA helicase RuvA
MIAYLKGNILQKTTSFLVIETGGLGYKVLVTPEILETKSVGDSVELYLHHKSGDDGQTLFGMPDFSTLQFFELLITITGVGPKMALAIVSAAKIDTLQQAISTGDVAIFTRMSGVGKKTAERIILELKNKMLNIGLPGAAESQSDVYDALINLGYNAKEVRDILPKLPDADMSDQIRAALKMLGTH